MALDSPSLIGMLMQAQKTEWPSDLASLVVKQLFDNFEPQDIMSLIDMNHLNKCIGLQTCKSNPQMMFEQIAALENQFKMPLSNMEKIAIAIKKLPAEYQPVLTAEMRKEGSLFVASNIENSAFQDWQSVHWLTWSSTVPQERTRSDKRNGCCGIQWNLQQMWSTGPQGS